MARKKKAPTFKYLSFKSEEYDHKSKDDKTSYDEGYLAGSARVLETFFNRGQGSSCHRVSLSRRVLEWGRVIMFEDDDNAEGEQKGFLISGCWWERWRRGWPSDAEDAGE